MSLEFPPICADQCTAHICSYIARTKSISACPDKNIAEGIYIFEKDRQGCMKKMTDERMAYLVGRVADAGDQLAFKELFTLFFERLLSYASAITKDQQVSQEHVEDVFVRLWVNRSMLRSVNNLSFYLYTSVKNASINYLNRNKQARFSLKATMNEEEYRTEYSPENIFVEKELFRSLDCAIESLPPKCRLVFRLVKEERMSYKQIAALLDISLKTIENHMNVAIKKILKTVSVHTYHHCKEPEAKKG